MRKQEKELRIGNRAGKQARKYNVRLFVTTYFQVPRNGGGEEVKPDVIGRSKNTRIHNPVVAAALRNAGGCIGDGVDRRYTYLSEVGRRIGERRRIEIGTGDTDATELKRFQ